jgi:hypothetical protein
MKRFSKEHVDEVARAFATDSRIHVWGMFGAEIREAIIDSAVMREMRYAEIATDTAPFTAAEIIAFRNAVMKRLAEGVVPAGSRGMKIRFEVA